MIRICVILFLLFLGTIYNPFHGPSKRIFIYPDETLSTVVDSLRDRGILVSKPWMLSLARITGWEKEIRPGYYWISTTEAPLSILSKLRKGGIDTIKVTIPEGYNLKQICDRLANYSLIDVDTFRLLLHDDEFIKELGIGYAHSLEGFLFPDTYIFSIFSSERYIMKRMVKRFFEIAREVGIEDSLYQLLILASIVEREARIDSERAIIADIFFKRLATGHPLESCATINYALGRHHRQLTYRDLRKDSPYNTYIYPGLPPSPICSPGKASLKAVFEPRSTEYFYFVSNGKGGHIFSTSYRQHILAKRRQKRDR